MIGILLTVMRHQSINTNDYKILASGDIGIKSGLISADDPGMSRAGGQRSRALPTNRHQTGH